MKALDAHELANALLLLPAGAMVACNAVGNLMLLAPSREYIGFVDMRTGDVILHQREDEQKNPGG